MSIDEVCKLDTNKFPKRKHDEDSLFPDEKMFDIDGVYNSHNDRIWAVHRATKVVLGENVNFRESFGVWLEVCPKGVSP